MKLYVVTHEFWGDQTELVSIEDCLSAARTKLTEVWNKHAQSEDQTQSFFDLPPGGCITPIDAGQLLGAELRDMGDIIEGRGCIRT